MTPYVLKNRLKDLVKIFQYENDTTKNKFRQLYKVALDAIGLAEQYKRELNDLRQAKLLDEPEARLLGDYVPPEKKPYKLPLPEPVAVPTKAERARYALRDGDDTFDARVFLKWSGLTLEQAKKIIADDAEKP